MFIRLRNRFYPCKLNFTLTSVKIDLMALLLEKPVEYMTNLIQIEISTNSTRILDPYEPDNYIHSWMEKGK